MTDVHVHDEGGLGDLLVTSPLVLGHEFSGVVTTVAPDVTVVKPGQRVAVDVLLACGQCRQCRQGQSNVCHRHRYLGFPPLHGGLASRVRLPAHCLHRLPDSLSFEEGALMEPLSVSINAVRRADVKVGDHVLVLGAGPIGLMTSQAARAAGASVVCVTGSTAPRSGGSCGPC
ncbi:uncharacterized protein LOC143297477 [Babylonia areolata]|uniref:uncharacterized protein LOC143297477 n=1 Tax=Babylonia areolata TaxID=304850 RepID=UPI003FD05683